MQGVYSNGLCEYGFAEPVCFAERGRFELPIAITNYDGLANRCLQPLGHLSKSLPAHGWKDSEGFRNYTEGECLPLQNPPQKHSKR